MKTSFITLTVTLLATHVLASGTLQRHAQTSRRHHQLASKLSTNPVSPRTYAPPRKQQTVIDSIDDPSIFERALDAEEEEEERKVLATQENWYNEKQPPKQAGADGANAQDKDDYEDDEQEEEDDSNIWGQEYHGDDEGDFYKLKRRNPKTRAGKHALMVMRGHGLIGYTDRSAGPSGATRKTTKRSGPNGSQAWLNNGISKVKRTSRWSPPKLRLSQLKTISLTDALRDPRSPFQTCKPYLGFFNSAAKRYNLPPILLASIAMQESSCNPAAKGDSGGAHGLMQLIGENCKGRSGPECSDPQFNIDTAAALFAENLNTAGGNILVALASYNGWYRGMSYKAATKAARSTCCDCQQNLDYLQQMLNGWLLGISPYQHRLGLLRNLDICGP